MQRTKKKGVNKVRTSSGMSREKDKLEKRTKRQIEKALDRKYKDTTENVLKQIELNSELSTMKSMSDTVDEFQEKITRLLSKI